MWKSEGKTRQKGRSSQTDEAPKSRVPALNQKKRDYRVYHFSAAEGFTYFVMYAALDACISYLFFYSSVAFVILLPGCIWFFEERKKQLMTRQKKEMKQQFLSGIQMMAASLQAGYSVENALKEAGKELLKIYDEDAFIVKEFQMMGSQISMNRTLEELLMDFGHRSGIADIQSFAEVFLTAKRSGGNLLMVIRNTVVCMRQKQETLQEIETCLSGRVMEQNIMSMIPMGILAYVKLTSPEFLSVMYGNLTGVTVMILCFVVYLGAYIWGQKITRIEV